MRSFESRFVVVVHSYMTAIIAQKLASFSVVMQTDLELQRLAVLVVIHSRRDAGVAVAAVAVQVAAVSAGHERRRVNGCRKMHRLLAGRQRRVERWRRAPVGRHRRRRRRYVMLPAAWTPV